MVGVGDTQIMKKAIESLFRVSYIFTSSSDIDSKEMNEIHMAFWYPFGKLWSNGID